MRKTIILISISLIVFACSKKDEIIRTSDMSVPQITGFEFKNEVGVITKIIGLPNNKLSDKQSNYHFTFYPNPAKDFGNIFIKTPNNNEIKQIWIVQAQYSKIIPNYSINNGMIIHTIGGTPLINLETSNNNFTINLNNLSNDYYRIYVQIGDVLLYDNIIIYK